MNGGVYTQKFEAEKAASKFELSTDMGEGFELKASGRQSFCSDYDKDAGKVFYKHLDAYELTLDLSENDADRINKVTVKLKGLEIELNNGWFCAETQWGWKTCVEYDAPKRHVKDVFGEEM